jgi:hypothetical protein
MTGLVDLQDPTDRQDNRRWSARRTAETWIEGFRGFSANPPAQKSTLGFFDKPYVELGFPAEPPTPLFTRGVPGAQGV